MIVEKYLGRRPAFVAALQTALAHASAGSHCGNRNVMCPSISAATQAETLLVDLDVRLLRDLAILVDLRLLKGRKF